MDFSYIVIEGNIGAGKTTLCKMLAKEFNGRLILEQFMDNPFLPAFYKDPARFSFQLELSFLAERYQQLTRDLASRDLFKPLTLADYYFMKSLIFAKETLGEEEYKLYQQIFNIMYKSMPKPDLYVYLHVDVDNLLVKIKKRGRDFESGIGGDYLNKIQNGYFNFFRQRNDISFLVIDVNKMDFVENQNDYVNIKHVIFDKKYKKGVTRIGI